MHEKCEEISHGLIIKNYDWREGSYLLAYIP